METEDQITYLDTHVVCWLYAGEINLFPKNVLTIIETTDLLISPMVELELQYLFEIGKINQEAKRMTQDLYARIGLHICTQSFETVIAKALEENWTRDPFDRIIVAQARLKNLPLLTKDRSLHKHYQKAFWD